MPTVHFQDKGIISYKEAWDYQSELHQELVQRKLANRGLDAADPSRKKQKHYLLFCEHDPVYTLGKSGSMDHLLLSESKLNEKEITFYKINRGGDITFHGKGQVVAYPIFDLDEFFTDVHKYVRFLEEIIIRTLAEYEIEAIRIKGFTGVWLNETENKPARKICAIGVHLSRWVTMHGFAFNVNTDLNYFKYIVPCGIVDENKEVTSLAAELGKTIDLDEIKIKIRKHFAELFEFEFSSDSV